MGVKIEKDVIYQNLKSIFPGYHFDMSEYTNTHCKIPTICDNGHKSVQIVKNLLKNHGCNVCGNLKSSDKQKSNIKDVIDIFRKKHGDKYDYSEFNYKNNRESSTIICPIHGGFKQSSWTHSKGHGCPSCSGNKKLNTDQFIEVSNKIHNINYIYNFVDYKNMHSKVKIICPLHGEFYQIPLHHIKGVGCPKCSQSKGERMVETYLNVNNIKFESQKKFDDCKHINHLIFDFYLPLYNTCIEFNGIQHYFSVGIFGGDEALEINKKRDKIKEEYCKSKDIKLIIIKQDKNHININDVNNQIDKIKSMLESEL